MGYKTQLSWPPEPAADGKGNEPQSSVLRTENNLVFHSVHPPGDAGEIRKFINRGDIT